MPITDSLKHRMDLFGQSGQAYKKTDDLFGLNSWIQVMVGQGLIPEQYHPIVDQMSDDELKLFLNRIKEGTAKKVSQWPNHLDFINHYCKSKVM